MCTNHVAVTLLVLILATSCLFAAGQSSSYLTYSTYSSSYCWSSSKAAQTSRVHGCVPSRETGSSSEVLMCTSTTSAKIRAYSNSLNCTGSAFVDTDLGSHSCVRIGTEYYEVDECKVWPSIYPGPSGGKFPDITNSYTSNTDACVNTYSEKCSGTLLQTKCLTTLRQDQCVRQSSGGSAILKCADGVMEQYTTNNDCSGTPSSTTNYSPGSCLLNGDTVKSCGVVREYGSATFEIFSAHNTTPNPSDDTASIACTDPSLTYHNRISMTLLCSKETTGDDGSIPYYNKLLCLDEGKTVVWQKFSHNGCSGAPIEETTYKTDMCTMDHNSTSQLAAKLLSCTRTGHVDTQSIPNSFCYDTYTTSGCKGLKKRSQCEVMSSQDICEKGTDSSPHGSASIACKTSKMEYFTSSDCSGVPAASVDVSSGKCVDDMLYRGCTAFTSTPPSTFPATTDAPIEPSSTADSDVPTAATSDTSTTSMPSSTPFSPASTTSMTDATSPAPQQSPAPTNNDAPSHSPTPSSGDDRYAGSKHDITDGSDKNEDEKLFTETAIIAIVVAVVLIVLVLGGIWLYKIRSANKLAKAQNERPVGGRGQEQYYAHGSSPGGPVGGSRPIEMHPREAEDVSAVPRPGHENDFQAVDEVLPPPPQASSHNGKQSAELPPRSNGAVDGVVISSEDRRRI